MQNPLDVDRALNFFFYCTGCKIKLEAVEPNSHVYRQKPKDSHEYKPDVTNRLTAVRDPDAILSGPITDKLLRCMHCKSSHVRLLSLSISE